MFALLLESLYNRRHSADTWRVFPVHPHVQSANAVRSLLLQIVFSLCVAVLWYMSGKTSVVLDVMCSAAVCFLPNFLLSSLLWRIRNKQPPKRLAIIFFIGEFAKLLLMAGGLALLIILSPDHFMAILTGFLAVQFAAWCAPFLPLYKVNEKVRV